MITLMTRTLELEFAKIGQQAEILNPILITRYYNPSGPGEWYPIEYDPKTEEFFGYVIGFPNNDWKSFRMDDLVNLQGPFGLGIQRDTEFQKTRFEDMPEY